MNTRIGYLVPQFPSQTHAFFWREVSAIREAGNFVQLFSTRPPVGEECHHEFAETARKQTVYLSKLDLLAIAKSLINFKGIAKITQYICGLKESSFLEKLHTALLFPAAARLVHFCKRENLSHVHFHSCASSGHLGAMAHCLSRQSYSLTLHGDLPVYGKDHRSKTSRARSVTAVTRPLQKQLLENTDLTLDQTSVIMMGVDTQRFFPVQKRNQGRTPEIVTIARLIEQKGHRDAFAALKILSEKNVSFEYIVAGDGPDFNALKEEVDRLGLNHCVTFSGSISERQVVQVLSDSDIFLLPSFGLGEAAPVCVMEAMACGLPVVCSLIGGTGDMIDHGRDGFLTPQRDVNSLVETLGKLLLDDSLRSQIGKAARTSAEEKFDYRTNAARLLAAVSKDTSAHPKPAMESAHSF